MLRLAGIGAAKFLECSTHALAVALNRATPINGYHAQRRAAGTTFEAASAATVDIAGAAPVHRNPNANAKRNRSTKDEDGMSDGHPDDNDDDTSDDEDAAVVGADAHGVSAFMHGRRQRQQPSVYDPTAHTCNHPGCGEAYPTFALLSKHSKTHAVARAPSAAVSSMPSKSGKRIRTDRKPSETPTRAPGSATSTSSAVASAGRRLFCKCRIPDEGSCPETGRRASFVECSGRNCPYGGWWCEPCAAEGGWKEIAVASSDEDDNDETCIENIRFTETKAGAALSDQRWWCEACRRVNPKPPRTPPQVRESTAPLPHDDPHDDPTTSDDDDGDDFVYEAEDNDTLTQIAARFDIEDVKGLVYMNRRFHGIHADSKLKRGTTVRIPIPAMSVVVERAQEQTPVRSTHGRAHAASILPKKLFVKPADEARGAAKAVVLVRDRDQATRSFPTQEAAKKALRVGHKLFHHHLESGSPLPERYIAGVWRVRSIGNKVSRIAPLMPQGYTITANVLSKPCYVLIEVADTSKQHVFARGSDAVAFCQKSQMTNKFYAAISKGTPHNGFYIRKMVRTADGAAVDVPKLKRCTGKQTGVATRAPKRVASTDKDSTCACGKVFASAMGLAGHRAHCKLPTKGGGVALLEPDQTAAVIETAGSAAKEGPEKSTRGTALHTASTGNTVDGNAAASMEVLLKSTDGVPARVRGFASVSTALRDLGVQEAVLRACLDSQQPLPEPNHTWRVHSISMGSAMSYGQHRRKPVLLTSVADPTVTKVIPSVIGEWQHPPLPLVFKKKRLVPIKHLEPPTIAALADSKQLSCCFCTCCVLRA